MAQAEAIKPTHRAIERYYQTLRRLSGEHVTHELALRPAFQNLLEDTAKQHGWSFIAELSVPHASRLVASHGHERDAHGTIRPDGTIRDGNSLPRGYWEAKDTPLSYRIEKMKLNKEKTVLWVNASLSLAGIPPQVFEYRLGNRSALDWVIDQYQVSEDKRSGIQSDPNRPDKPEYIVRLVGQVVRVSVETVKIVNSLPRSYE